MAVAAAARRSWMDRFIDTIEWLAAIFVGIVALDVFAIVMLRRFFNTAIAWSPNEKQIAIPAKVGGEDALYIARRLVRFASEDIGNADPQALRLALDAKESYHFLGTPEGELALAQAACYLALAPKSNAVYAAWNQVRRDIQDKPAEPVPLHLRNAPTGLMANQGYGKGYQYAHDAPDAKVDQQDLPDSLRGRQYYRPTDRGLEAELGRRLAEWRRWRSERHPPRV